MTLRYIIVNEEHKSSLVDCVCCKSPLNTTYTRDIATGLTYHSPWCFETRYDSERRELVS